MAVKMVELAAVELKHEGVLMMRMATGLAAA